MSMGIWQIAIGQAAGIIALALILWVFWRLADKFGKPFIDSQRAQAEAMRDQALAMRDMRDTVHEFIHRDNSDHREIIIGLQVVANEVKALSALVRGHVRYPLPDQAPCLTMLK